MINSIGKIQSFLFFIYYQLGLAVFDTCLIYFWCLWLDSVCYLFVWFVFVTIGALVWFWIAFVDYSFRFGLMVCVGSGLFCLSVVLCLLIGLFIVGFEFPAWFLHLLEIVAELLTLHFVLIYWVLALLGLDYLVVICLLWLILCWLIWNLGFDLINVVLCLFTFDGLFTCWNYCGQCLVIFQVKLVVAVVFYCCVLDFACCLLLFIIVFACSCFYVLGYVAGCKCLRFGMLAL